MKLVIVESPAKCETIKKYLGEDYRVEASLGHVRDLATRGKGGLGVDIEHGFVPTYIINKEKEGVVKKLHYAAKSADEVILATDPDREGEAIAWHLAEVLHLNVDKTKRIEFHEITRASITEAMKNPRKIDGNLVASQETRRILDRIIGFELSTLMNKMIHSKSAGRVQSATLKLIYDHDLEVESFEPKEYWDILTSITFAGKTFDLSFISKDGKKVNINNKEQADEILSLIKNDLEVVSVTREKRIKESKEPFTTSTMQQEAFSRLKFKTDKTQREAQKLYEGIQVGSEHVGLITYMRTDSTRLSDSYVARANAYILETFGKDYVGTVKKGKKKELAQDAHEAIRPTSNHRTPESVKNYLSYDQYRLYKLIYNRALASLMKPKIEEVLVVTLKSNNLLFKFELTRTLFKGYEILISEPNETKEYEGTFPDIQEGMHLSLVKKSAEQKFTQPPARYSEAKLVKIMEDVGIGRPSTYASTIKLLRDRKYVEDVDGILKTTEQGRKTSHVLEKYFPDIVDSKYTASMELKLDNVQEGNESRIDTLSEFYNQFESEYQDAKNRMYVDEPVPAGRKCPKCGSELVYKKGQYGDFIGCINFPKCDYIEKQPTAEPEYTGENCPKCGKPLVFRKAGRSRRFIGCSGYPTCDYMQAIEQPSTNKICPTCGGKLVRRKGKRGTYFLGCENYPNCTYMEKITRNKRK